jgi:hypothetical protein
MFLPGLARTRQHLARTRQQSFLPVRACLAAFLAVLLIPTPSHAYSVLTHEEVVDLVWESDIKPLLQQRFPHATAEDLVKAHAYAYGGCIIQDMGYYPFGNSHFSDMVHYVRSGDFVAALLKDAHDLNGLAFALGGLAHYVSDIHGHPMVNRAVAMEFPDLQRKFGSSVTYEDDKKAHIRSEFGFDVAEVAKNRYAPKAYHDFIGFEVDKELLEQAFRETYGVELKDIFKSLDLSIGSYRFAVGTMIPKLTKAALLTKSNVDVPDKNSQNLQQFRYYLSRAEYEKEWGRNYERPGIGARILAFLFKLVPKVGPFKAVAFQVPDPQTQDMFLKSIDDTVATYKRLATAMRAGQRTELPNMNFDTSQPTQAGKYRLADESYRFLLGKLDDGHFRDVPEPLRADVLHFYNQADAFVFLKDEDKIRKIRRQLSELGVMQAAGKGENTTPATAHPTPQ